MQNCTETWTARKSSDTIPNTRDVVRPISLTIGCWRFSSMWERHRIKCRTTTKSMPGKKIARKRPGSRREADLALRTARALPPPFLLWLVAYCTFSTPPWPMHRRRRRTSAWKRPSWPQTKPHTWRSRAHATVAAGRFDTAGRDRTRACQSGRGYAWKQCLLQRLFFTNILLSTFCPLTIQTGSLWSVNFFVKTVSLHFRF